MSRLSFETKGEPGSMMPLLDALSDASRWTTAAYWVVPGGAQTEEYATAVLNQWAPPSVAAQRAKNRSGRGLTLIEAGVPTDIYTTTRALGNLGVVGGNKEALLGQLARLTDFILMEMQTGDESLVRVRIVTTGNELIPYQAQPPMCHISPTDAILITAPKYTRVAGPEAFEMDDIEADGLRGEVVSQRMEILETWQRQARQGVAALDLIRHAQEAVEAA